MEKVLKESGEESLGKEFCQRLTKSFNRSSGRAGKPVIKWTEIQSWFQARLPESPEFPKNELTCTKGQSKEGGVIRDPLELEFEARSSKDGAWYDVEKFLNHRFLSTGEAVSSHHFKFHSIVLPGLMLGLIILTLPTKSGKVSSLIQFCPLLKEVRVRFIGFGAEEDEWVNIKNAVRERSVPLENTECSNLKVGDPVLCFQERRDQAIYYDAHILEIQRKVHDIRGCRCLFLIRYDHDNSEDKVRLRRLCRRPKILG